MSEDSSPETGLSVLMRDDPKRYYLRVLGPLGLGLSLGLQVTLTAFMLLGPSSDAWFADQLTEYGKSLTRPEHELPIYCGGVVFTLVSIWVTEWWWRGKLQRIPAGDLAGFMTLGALLQGTAATASMLMYLLLLSSRYVASASGLRKPAGAFHELMLLLPATMAVVWMALDMEYGHRFSSAAPDRFNQWRLRSRRVLLYGMPVFVILVIAVPPGGWTDLAGKFFLTDGLHHLNFFMMGPALSFSHGQAFGTEIYSQYGIGWPLLSSTLSRISRLTYGNLVGLETIYGCIYYLALYFLLRNCFKQEVWAVIGAVLAFYWQIFSGMDRSEVIWLFPSSTLMRHALDVWFFLVLVMHRRSGRMLWVALAGPISALGIFFETETGFYLVVTFLVYWGLQAGLAPGAGRPSGMRASLFPLVLFYGTAAATLLPLLLYASRGALFTQAFWRGWAEPIVRYGAWGVSALPMAELPDDSIIFFAVMFAVYLAVLGYTIIRSLRRIAASDEVLLATVAAYGLALLLLFVNRSHPYNLYHPAVPFAIVLTALMVQGRRALASVLRYSSFPYVLAGGLILLLLTKAEFLRYPSLLRSFFDPPARGGLSLLSNPTDISGLPPEAAGFVQEVNNLVSATRIIAAASKDVAILDFDDTLLYYAANLRPWSRYSSLFHLALTKKAIGDIRNDLIERPAKCVIIRGENSRRPANWEFVWSPLYELVKSRYVLHETVGHYEIWLRPNG